MHVYIYFQITEEQALYEKKLLRDLNFSKFESHFKPLISHKQPGDGLVVRPLQSTDYHAGWYTESVTYLIVCIDFLL